MSLFTETDLQQIVGDSAYGNWLAHQVLEARPDGLWFPSDRPGVVNGLPLAQVIRHLGVQQNRPISRAVFQHPLRDLNRPVLPFPFSLTDFTSFALHPRFDLRDLWIDVNPDDTEALDEAGIAAVVESHRPAAELFSVLFPLWAAGNGRGVLESVGLPPRKLDAVNVRHQELFERLRPTSNLFRGGRVTDSDVLTLDEAAAMASRHAGEEVKVSDFLRAAGRGEILLRAVVHRRAKVVKPDGGICINAGHPTDENTIPEGSIPTLPLVACSQLASIGRATWRTIDEVRADEYGERWRRVKYRLAPNEPDYETVPDDCRVTGGDVHALADAFREPDVSDEVDAQDAAVARPSWYDVTIEYVAGRLRASSFATAKELYDALLKGAGEQESPFDKGAGQHRGLLFVREISKPVALKTFQNKWGEIRREARKK